MTRALVFMLTCTSAVVMGAALLIAQIDIPDVDTGGSVALLVLCSFAFGGLAWWLHNSEEAK